jgi:hypothetical protein
MSIPNYCVVSYCLDDTLSPDLAQYLITTLNEDYEAELQG